MKFNSSNVDSFSSSGEDRDGETPQNYFPNIYSKSSWISSIRITFSKILWVCLLKNSDKNVIF